MQRTLILLFLACALVMVAGTGAVFAEESKDDPGQMTVQGEILDMACYASNEAKGPEHAACAKRCVKGGQPMGLLAKDGTVYLLYASHENGSAFEQAKEHAGENVEITGVAATRAGFKSLEVHGVKPI